MLLNCGVGDQFLSFLFTYLLPAVSSSLILCVPPIVRARILCLLTLQVPGAVRPISNNIVDVARLVKHPCFQCATYSAPI